MKWFRVISVAVSPFFPPFVVALAAAVAPPPPPQTREAVASILIGQGFSSVTTVRHEGSLWTGEGVRNGSILEFAVDPAGKVTTRRRS